jgi:ribonuclease HI
MAQGYDNLIIEGDSQIIINMFKILQHGSSTLKIKKLWHLEASLEAIQQMFAFMPMIIPRHVKRSTNNIEDQLANEILRIKEDSWEKPWSPSEDKGFSQPYATIARQDLST